MPVLQQDREFSGVKWDEPSVTDPYSSAGGQVQPKVIAPAQEFEFKTLGAFYTEPFEPTHGPSIVISF